MRGTRAVLFAFGLLVGPSLRTTLAGEASWEMTLGTAREERAGAAHLAEDGGFVVVGTTRDASRSVSIFRVKVDAEGRPSKWKTYGGYAECEVRSAWPVEGGGSIICGWLLDLRPPEGRGKSAFLRKATDSGVGSWIQTFESLGWDTLGNGCRRTKTGGFILTGDVYQTLDDPQVRLLIAGTDADGTRRGEGSVGLEYDSLSGRDILMSDDGGYVIASVRTNPETGESDIDLEKQLVLPADPMHIVWWRSFDLGGRDAAHGLWQTADGGFLIVGDTAPRPGDPTDACLIRTDSEGNEIWRRTYGGEGWDTGRSVRETADGGLIICGSTTSFGSGGLDVWLIETDAEGREVWSRTFGGRSDDEGSWVLALEDGGALIVGTTSSFGAGETDAYIIRTDADGRVPPHFIRGDANGDGILNISDAVAVIYSLFAASPCRNPDAMDVGDDGVLDLSDAVSLLDFLFQGGAPPRAPYPEPGFDPTPDSLRCEG